MSIPCKELIDKGICKADCCGIVPIEKDIYNKYKDLINEDKIVELVDLDNYVCALTEDLKCIFLGDDLKCKIYDERPDICRDYGLVKLLPCPFADTNGKIRSDAKRKRCQRQINQDVNYKLNFFRKRIKGIYGGIK